MRHLTTPFVTFSLGAILLGVALRDWTVPVGLIGIALIIASVAKPLVRWLSAD